MWIHCNYAFLQIFQNVNLFLGYTGLLIHNFYTHSLKWGACTSMHFNSFVKGGVSRIFLEGNWWEREGLIFRAGSGFSGKAIVTFTSQLLFDLLFTSDWKMFYHLLFFTYLFGLFPVILIFFNSVLFYK